MKCQIVQHRINQLLVPKTGSRRSDGPISRFRFCGENVGMSLFVVCSYDSIFRTKVEHSLWCQNDHRDIMQNLSAPFIFQEECRMKVEHVLFLSVSSKLRIRVLEGEIESLKMDRVNGPLVSKSERRLLTNLLLKIRL